jgi:hypothetical protein
VSTNGCSITFTSVGVKYLRATYAGDGTFSPSVSTLIAHSVKAATTTTITNITLAGVGQTVVVRYKVTSTAQGIPVGMVTVRSGTDTCSAPATTGTCRLTFSSAGMKSVTASFAGDSSFYGSVSAAVTHTVVGVFLPLIRR